MANLIGPDVSFYQDAETTPQGINFTKMKQSAGYVVIRSGQNVWVDSDFRTNWANAKAVGLPRGSYWFYDSRAEPRQQADLWYSTFDGDLGELPLFADFEESYGGLYAGWRHWKTFLERLKERVGDHEIGIYTAYYYWIRNAPSATTDAANLAYFKQYPLWVANYGVTTPLVPKPWDTVGWTFWQFTDSGDGDLYGVESSRIDLNYFNGDQAAFNQRFKMGDTPPPPPPGPVWYKVTASALNVRSGPATTFGVVGLLSQNEVVEGIAISADSAWAQIKRASDGLIGWSSRQFLTVTSAPPPPPPPPPPPGESEWYKVNASALNVREGPGTEFRSKGLVYRNEVLRKLAESEDGNWLQIKRHYDDFTGWASKQYLVETTEPPPVIEETFEWYKVTAATLNVREGPAATFRAIGYLQNGETVMALETSPEGWKKIQKVDGFTGWASGQFLTNVGKTPASAMQKLFKGVTYYRKVRLSPRRLVSHTMIIDLKAATFEFLVTPPLRTVEPYLCTQLTSKFLEKNKLHIAINADGFYALDPATFPSQVYCPDDGEPVKLIGLAASRGKQYSTKAPGRPVMYISQKNVVTFDKFSGNIFNAITGDRVLISKGVKAATLESVSMDPRTAVGVNQNGRYMVMVVVDGREFSEGATFPELADLLLAHSVYTGIALDGGGSSAMIVKGADGAPRAVNKLMDANIPGQERAVANHLGVFIK